MSGISYLLDTNILIGFLKGSPEVVDYWQRELIKGALFISQITRMELLGFPEMLETEEAKIRGLLSHLQVLPVSEDVEKQAILLRRSQHLKLPDAIIAGTAKAHSCTLITCDQSLADRLAGACPVHNPCHGNAPIPSRTSTT
jgi:predicted nucleic acid-binding protein